MKIKINMPMLGVNLIPIKEDGKIITLGEICIATLLAPVQGDDEKVKLEKWDIYKKFRDCKGDTLDLTTEEITLLKRVIGKIQPQLIVGQTFEIIEKGGTE
jgi:hypothetical protein